MPTDLTSPQVSVCREAQSALASSPLYDLRELRVEEMSDHRLVLHGVVHSFYHKQLAQEALLAVARPHAYRVVNDVIVIDALTN